MGPRRENVTLRVAIVAGPPAGWTAELEALLRGEGADVLVLNGPPAVPAADVSLVLLDQCFLGQQPRQALDRLRLDFPGALLCLLTRYSRRPPEAQALAWGFWDALYLPAQLEEVRDLLGRGEAFFERRARAERPQKILIVDDEESIREVSAALLDQMGYRVETAADPLEAIGRILQGGLDLVVTDLQMPGMDGVALLKRIREAQPLLPVVISTGHATVEAAIAALRTGATDFIRKPFTGEDFLQVIGRALRFGALSHANVELEAQARAEKSRLRGRQYELLVLAQAIAEMSCAVNPGQVAECWLRAAGQVLDFACAGFYLNGSAPELVVLEGSEDCPTPAELVQTLARHAPGLVAGPEVEGLRVRRLESTGLRARAPGQPLVHVLGPAAHPCAGVVMHQAPSEALTAEQEAFLHGLTVPAAQVLEKLRALAGEARLREAAMVAGMHQGVILADLEGRVLVMNAAVRELLGLAPGEEVHSLSRLSATLEIPLEEAVKRLLTAGADTFTREFQLPPPRELILTLDLTLIRGDSREPIAVVGLLRDITELREAERMKTEFVAIVSHELRTPLTTIKNCNSLLLGGSTGAITPHQERFLRMAQVSIDRITRLVNDLLDIAKIESGRLPLEFTTVDLPALLREVGNETEHLLLAQGLRLEVAGADVPLVVVADRDRLKQVFFNLVHNAVKFSAPGGLIAVRVREGAAVDCPPELRTQLRSPDLPFVEVQVIDEGVGIATEDLGRIFDRFQQVEQTLRREHGGIGLGLPISRGIVRSHGGEIWAERHEPTGSVFRVLLPRGLPPARADEAVAESAPMR
jgi:PAS domain S-box-containing protein